MRKEGDTQQRSALVTTEVNVRRIGLVNVEVETRRKAVHRLLNAIASNQHGVWGFCNAHTVNTARDNVEFRRALECMTLFNDGTGLNIASRMLYGGPFLDNLNGTDLTPDLLAELPIGTLIFIIGGRAEICAAAANHVANRYPHLKIAGTRHGYFDHDDERDIVRTITASGAQLILVGMGHPRQEVWAVRHSAAIAAPLLCVGAMIDRLAGAVPRAPKFMRQAGIEWIYRLVREPRRLAGRYIVGNFTFLLHILAQRVAMLARRSGRT